MWPFHAISLDDASVSGAVPEEINMLNRYLKSFLDWFMSKMVSIVIAVVFLVICFKLIKIFVKFLKKTFAKSNLDASVAGFFISAIKVLLDFLVIITAASMVGFQITSFITLLGTAGVTIGLALQGSLSNLAGGVLILILKPFRVGDYIVENNTKCEGTVVSIDIFYTKLITVDNKSVVIPNGNISNTSLINVTEHDKRRVDISFDVEYSSDMEKVKTVVLEQVKSVEGFRPNDQVDFFIDSFGESGIKVYVRFFVDISNYFPAMWDAKWKIKKAFDENGISFPYNKLDVNLGKDE